MAFETFKEYKRGTFDADSAAVFDSYDKWNQLRERIEAMGLLGLFSLVASAIMSDVKWDNGTGIPVAYYLVIALVLVGVVSLSCAAQLYLLSADDRRVGQKYAKYLKEKDTLYNVIGRADRRGFDEQALDDVLVPTEKNSGFVRANKLASAKIELAVRRAQEELTNRLSGPSDRNWKILNEYPNLPQETKKYLISMTLNDAQNINKNINAVFNVGRIEKLTSEINKAEYNKVKNNAQNAHDFKRYYPVKYNRALARAVAMRKTHTR